MRVRITYRNKEAWTTISGPLTKETADSYYIGQVRVMKEDVIPNSLEVLPNEAKKATPPAGDLGISDH